MIALPRNLWSQERFQDLYSAAAIQKHHIGKITIELFAGLEGLDSTAIAKRSTDYIESFWYDEQGRPTRYDATDINIHNQGKHGPHIVSSFEYSENGRVSHRHDSTAFGRSSEWQFVTDSLGRRTSDHMILPDEPTAHIKRQYIYDLKGRLQKIKTTRDRSAEGLSEDCTWMFYVHDSHSFNATSLSPMEMARCQCNLEYLDVEKRPARRVVYDSTATITQTLLLNYDRTGNPIRVESLDPSGKVLHAWVDIVYARGGIVTVETNGAQGVDVAKLRQLGMIGQAFVIEHWSDWRLLREVRVKIGGLETSRHIFSYDL